jgi:hypothetical protein
MREQQIRLTSNLQQKNEIKMGEHHRCSCHAESWGVSALEAIGQLFVSTPKQTGS